MTVTSIKTGADDNVRRIAFSDGSLFTFKIYYLPPLFTDETLYTPGIAEGREISADEEAGFRFASACLRAEKAALQLIARAEQTVFGLSRKLKKRGHDSACIGAVISQLCALDLLDDRRYARLWLESRLNRQASSPRRLLAALHARGIDRHDAEAAIKETIDSEAEQRLLARFAERLQRRQSFRKRTSGDYDESSARRSLRYTLKGEGFSTAAIQIFFDE